MIGTRSFIESEFVGLPPPYTAEGKYNAGTEEQKLKSEGEKADNDDDGSSSSGSSDSDSDSSSSGSEV